MLTLLLLPALLGIGMMISPYDLSDLNFFRDDDDEGNADDLPTLVEPETSDIFEGTEDAERLIGNETTSEMLGYGGDDVILGNGGGDAIDAGAGNDTVFGGAGSDFVAGGEGDDRVFLGDGDDQYTPDDGGDPYDAGNDFVRGGAGGDLIADLSGSNILFGDLGSDTLVGFDGVNENGIHENPDELRTTDTLSGGYGNDTLAGDYGDVLTGGAHADTFIALDNEDPEQEEIHVTDFEPEKDNLVISTLSDMGDVGAIELTFDESIYAVRASYEGRDVAVLAGLTAGDIPNINVALVPFSAV